jgi:hypothetical protein
MRFAPPALTKIAPLGSATSHTPKTLTAHFEQKIKEMERRLTRADLVANGKMTLP